MNFDNALHFFYHIYCMNKRYAVMPYRYVDSETVFRRATWPLSSASTLSTVWSRATGCSPREIPLPWGTHGVGSSSRGEEEDRAIERRWISSPSGAKWRGFLLRTRGWCLSCHHHYPLLFQCECKNLSLSPFQFQSFKRCGIGILLSQKSEHLRMFRCTQNQRNKI